MVQNCEMQDEEDAWHTRAVQNLFWNVWRMDYIQVGMHKTNGRWLWQKSWDTILVMNMWHMR